jgi:hypothetical protein
MSEQIEGTDRYGNSGPDPETMCDGQCEGFGRYPAKFNDIQASLNASLNQKNVREAAAWVMAHEALGAHTDGECDGWHFILCPTCLGTGRAAPQVVSQETTPAEHSEAQG